MRVLFDHNMPVGVRKILKSAGHEVVTSPEVGWEQLKDGPLLKAAEDAGFDVMLTSDKNLRYQQNVSARKIALVVLGSNNWPVVQNYTSRILEAVNAARPNTFTFIGMPLQPKPKYRPTSQL